MNPLVVQINDLLKDMPFAHAFCGGVAIDLFLGYESRRHSDVDICACWDDRNEIIEAMLARGFMVYEMLGGGKSCRLESVPETELRKNIFCIRDGCEIMRTIPTGEPGIYWNDFRSIGQSKPDYLEFLFSGRAEGEFVCGRDGAIRRPLEKAILSEGRFSFLAPEICLLYKAETPERDGYQQDYELAMQKMSGEQKAWLNDALMRMYPEGHAWII